MKRKAQKKTARLIDVRREVAEVDRRLGTMEKIARMSIETQFDQIAKAEQLRKLAAAVAKACERSAGSDNTKGFFWINERPLRELAAFVATLDKFHTPPRRKIPAAFLPKKGGALGKAKS